MPIINKVYTDTNGQRVRFKRQFLDDAAYTLGMQAFVVVCADIIPYLEDGRIILATRRNLPAAHVWEFGGRVLPGETYIEACVRKMKQETGQDIDSSLLHYLGNPRYFWPNRQQTPQDVPCDCEVHTYGFPTTPEMIPLLNSRLDPNEYVGNSVRPYTRAELMAELEGDNLHPATLELYDEIFK